MRRIILFLAFLVFLFLVNIIFYFLSEDYQFFLKKIKNNNEIVYIDWSEVNDSLRDNFIETNSDITIIEYRQKNQEVEEKENKNTENKINIIDTEIINSKQETVLGRNYQVILDLFSRYNLNQIELATNLFDITDEYPDSYYEFYSQNVTLYFFDTKTYSEVYDVFDVLAYDLPFAINTVNNFWNESFYINLNEDIKDNYIRSVINYKWIVFGLKIKKTEYNTIKNNLWELKN